MSGLAVCGKAANRVAILVCADALRYSGVKDQLSKIGSAFRQERRTPKMLRLETIAIVCFEYVKRNSNNGMLRLENWILAAVRRRSKEAASQLAKAFFRAVDIFLPPVVL
jgi:hypothetical protein